MNTPSPDDTGFLATQARHVRQCLREARVVAIVWLLGFIYCGTTLSLLGWIPPEDRPVKPELILGMPSWVVWGLWLPWLVLVVVTWWFAICVLKDDEPYQEFPTATDETPNTPS